MSFARDLAAIPARHKAWLGLASAVMLAAAPAQYLGRQHDDILFVIASHALSYGEYVLFTAPGKPPLTHVTPGLPFILMPVTWLAGDWFAAYQVACALMAAGIPWLLWPWLRRRLEPAACTLVCGLFAASPVALTQAGCVMPEAPYTLVALLLLFALEQGSSGSGPAGWLLALATQVRPAGLSLFPAALMGAVMGRRWRDAARIAGPAVAGLALWTAWSCLRSGGTQEILEWGASYDGGGPGRALSLAASNLRFLLTAWGGCFLPPSLANGALALAAGLSLTLLAAVGLGSSWRRDRGEPACWMLAAAGAMHAAWGWQYERYLIPLLPWLWWGAARALGRRAAPVLAALLALQVAFHTHRWLRRSPYSEPELKRAYSWIRSRLPPSEAMASALYARDGYLTGRPAAPLPAGDSATMAARLRHSRIRYVLWQDGLDLGWSGEGSGIARAFEEAGRNLRDTREFELIYEDPGEGARVYSVKGSGQGGI